MRVTFILPFPPFFASGYSSVVKSNTAGGGASSSKRKKKDKKKAASDEKKETAIRIEHLNYKVRKVAV